MKWPKLMQKVASSHKAKVCNGNDRFHIQNGNYFILIIDTPCNTNFAHILPIFFVLVLQLWIFFPSYAIECENTRKCTVEKTMVL